MHNSVTLRKFIYENSLRRSTTNQSNDQTSSAVKRSLVLNLIVVCQALISI
jgi:hypothetical protein